MDDIALDWANPWMENRSFVDKVINFFVLGLALYVLAQGYSWATEDNVVKRQVKCRFCRKRVSDKVSFRINDLLVFLQGVILANAEAFIDGSKFGMKSRRKHEDQCADGKGARHRQSDVFSVHLGLTGGRTSEDLIVGYLGGKQCNCP